MIRVAYVTTEPPSLRSGGGLHCYSNLRALCELPSTTVSYVGPRFGERLEGLGRLKVGHARPYAFRDKVQAFTTRAATSLAGLYAEWRRAVPEGAFDLAFVESTKAGFVISDLRRHCPTICCVHNVEADYLAVGRRGTGRLSALNVQRSERTSLRESDALLVLHRHDIARLKERYAVPGLEDRVVLHPVCAIADWAPIPYEARRRRVVIPGALDQAYNERGILAFLRECWPSLRSLQAELVIAGRQPRRVLVRAAKNAGATVIPNPESMREIVRDARVVVVPDLGGAGMKLRVAEALSLGVPTVGTVEGMLGYDDAAEFGRAVPTLTAMTEAVRELVADPVLGAQMARRARQAWEVRYSFPAFADRVKRAVMGLTVERETVRHKPTQRVTGF